MSALNRIKGLILSEMKGSTQDMKKAITRVINAIDSDLDTQGYQQSSDVDDAFDNLDTVLIAADTPAEEPEEDLVFNNVKKVPSLSDNVE